jgi:hypothetical protein
VKHRTSKLKRLTKAGLKKIPIDRRKLEKVKQRKLGRRIKDISNFFTEIPRSEFREKLDVLMGLLEKQNKTWKYF